MKTDTLHHYERKGSLPAWLQTPPAASVRPPVETRVQELPFGELLWEAFEKLCLRLTRLEADVEHCQLYGERGQNQEGIDIYAIPFRSEKYRVYQCKREKNFGPTKIKKAVDRFLEDTWVNKSDTLYLCTTQSLVSTDRAKALEVQRERLRLKGVALISWDSQQLSIKLKDYPEIVDDFFGREWVKAFCGIEEAEKLGRRLDAQGVAEFRKKLAAFYRRVFNKHDPGIPIIATSNADGILPLENRYVLPDVDDKRTLILSQSPEQRGDTTVDVVQPLPESAGRFPPLQRHHEVRHKSIPLTHYAASYKHRHEIESWLSAAERSVVLGGPGSGKSALLRFLTLDLLRDSPRLSHLAQKWGSHLPVWVPFALWTKMISASPANDASLKDLLHTWLRSWDEEGLWPLVESALEDSRLLLLVDGLDEWTNENAAVIAVDRLQVFVEQRNLPVVVTSRPQGFNRLGMQVTDWRVGSLSEFSTEQQTELVGIWFAFRLRAAGMGQMEDTDDLDHRSGTETEEFMAELHDSPDLRELARVPLLLTLLIAHRSYNARLPQSRFNAYDSLIEHLLSTHPRRRMTAAALTQPAPGLGEDDTRRILSYLAYRMHERFSEGIIEQNQAASIVEDFLKGGDGGFFDFDPFDARKYTKQVLEAGENTIGLLVRKSPRELGFFHRAFQEYLAALYISGMPFAQQLAIVGERCNDPQWREVILALLHATSRQEDVEQFIERIRGKEISAVDRYAVESLLSETAFGDFNCSVRLARELAREAFKIIETGNRFPHRETLLRQALEGLRSTKVKEIVKSKVREWFPRRSWWQQKMIFEAMSEWSPLPDTVNCLFRGIHDEDVSNQRQAARSLADIAKGEAGIGRRLAQLASGAIEPLVRAAALEGLLRGWPKHEQLLEIVQSARASLSPELILVGILGSIQTRMQTEDDQKQLLSLGSGMVGLDYQWQDEVASALIAGWPHSQEIKNACFHALREGRRQEDVIDRSLAGRILLEGFPQDDEVAGFCAEEVKKLSKGEISPLLSLKYDNWKLLAENFKEHKRLVPAIDEWLPVVREHEWIQFFYAALIGRTNTAKVKLFTYLSEKKHTRWVVKTLLDGWGMKDRDVALKLRGIAFGSTTESIQIADFLPRIIEDKAKCRKRLLDLLQNREDRGCQYLVLHSLEELGEGNRDDGDDVNLIDLALGSPGETEPLYDLPRLIQMSPSDPRVRQLAEQELSDPDGSHWAVAKAYGGDDNVRRIIIGMVGHLAAPLRKVITSQLADGIGDEEFALSVLELYDKDHDDEVLSQGAISYHKRLKASGRDLTPAVEKLSHDIVSVGPSYHETRRAALAGLLTLGRLDVMVTVKEDPAVLGERPCHVPTIGGLSLNVPLIKTVLQNWSYVKETLGAEMWVRLSDFPSDANPMKFWEETCPFVDEYPAAREDAITLLESERSRKPNVLNFIARARSKSRVLLEHCLHALAGTNQRNLYRLEEITTAAQLLGIHFSGDQYVLAQLLAQHPIEVVESGEFDEALIIALCEGWSESNELGRIYEAAKRHNPSLSYSAYFHLVCRKGRSQTVFNELLIYLKVCDNNNHIMLPVAGPIIRRIQSDDELLGLLAELIKGKPTPSEKVTALRLISSARGVSPELRAWCVVQAEEQLTDAIHPEVGFDIIAGGLRPAAHVLLDVLNLS